MLKEHSFQELKKTRKYDHAGKRKVRVALLGDTATQFLSLALQGAGYYDGLELEIWEADFNQVERQVFDPASELYEFDPEIVIIFHSAHKLLGEYNKLAKDAYGNLADTRIELVKELYATLAEKLTAKIIYYNYCEIDDAVFGNYAAKVSASFLFQLRKLNYELMLFAVQEPGFYICDISSIQNSIGKKDFFSTSIYINTEMVISLDALPPVAYKTTSIIRSLYGNFKKCVVLDLDNTVWGGIIGDDGIELIQVGALGIGKAFSEFQYWIKKLKNRGIIIAVCSKNTEATAKEPFLHHNDMVLKLDDIAVFVANWENKVDNLYHIQSTLNIGFDSMVFLDDNPFERNMVRESIPAITVPELPADPSDYLEYLYPLNLFEGNLLFRRRCGQDPAIPGRSKKE